MNISITLPDDSLDAWNFALGNYNTASPKSLTLPEYINDIIVGAQTNSNVSAYASYQLTQLVPLGEKYNAAPKNVQEQIDALLAPFNP
jgi:hypothetical protein